MVNRGRQFIILIGLLLTLLTAISYLYRPTFLTYLDYKIYDLMLQSTHNEQITRKVIILDIDEKSLAEFGQWPWPRYRLASLTDKLRALGAKNIIFDIIFPEADRTSPLSLKKALARDFQIGLEYQGLPHKLKDNDQIFADALAQGSCVLGVKFLHNPLPWRNKSEGRLHPVNAVIKGEANPKINVDAFFQAQGVVCSIAKLSQAAADSGFIDAGPDLDGVVRRIPLLMAYQGRLYPSLALAAIIEHWQTNQIVVETGGQRVESVVLRERRIPLSEKGSLLINFRGRSGAFTYVSAHDVLKDLVPPQKLQDKIVLVGTTAAGLNESHATPLQSHYPGIEIQATIIDNILSGDFLSRPYFIRGLELILIFLAGILSTLLLTRVGPWWSIGILLAGALGIFGGARWVMQTQGLVISPLYPVLALLISFVALTLLKYWQEEKKVQASGKSYRELFNSIMDVVFTHDLSGRLLTFNPACSNILGYKPDELEGRSITEFMDALSREAFHGHYLESIQQLGKSEGRFTLTARNGSEHYLDYKGKLVTTDQRNPYISVSGRDVTDKTKTEAHVKFIESQLAQSQRLEAIGTLASGIAHDFNNVLQAISGNTQLMLSDHSIDRRHKDRLEHIDRTVHRAAGIVRRLLSYSRKTESKREPVNLNQEILHMVDILKHALPKMVRVETKLDKNLHPISGDISQLEQVLMNLSTNARDAMAGEGRLSFKTENLILEENHCRLLPEIKPGHYVHLEVSDTGTGMDPQIAAHIFEPFFTTKEVGSGTGLGLFTVYGIIRGHKGQITCQSKPGLGTTFHVYLPALAEEEQRSPVREIKESLVKGGNETILLVDDESAILEASSEIMEQMGYKVWCAANGEEALAIYQEKRNQIHLIVLDLGMPGIGGQKTMQEILKINPEARIIISSGYTTGTPLQKDLLDKVAGFLRKPYRAIELLKQIRFSLER